MKTYKVELFIRAECKADVEELLEDYTGQETHIVINKVGKPTRQELEDIGEEN